MLRTCNMRSMSLGNIQVSNASLLAIGVILYLELLVLFILPNWNFGWSIHINTPHFSFSLGFAKHGFSLWWYGLHCFKYYSNFIVEPYNICLSVTGLSPGFFFFQAKILITFGETYTLPLSFPDDVKNSIVTVLLISLLLQKFSTKDLWRLEENYFFCIVINVFVYL